MLCPAPILATSQLSAEPSVILPSAERLRHPRPSFRAKCPAPLLLREAPGHAVEESLLERAERKPSRGGTIHRARQTYLACHPLRVGASCTRESAFPELFQTTNEMFMHHRIARQLRMKSRGQHTPLLHKHRMPGILRKHLNSLSR